MLRSQWLRFVERIDELFQQDEKRGAVRRKILAGVHEAFYESLIERYSGEKRPLHNLELLEFCLGQFELVRKRLKHPIEVEMTVWYHDYLREPEENPSWIVESAMATRQFARILGLEDSSADLVAKLIRSLSHASVPESSDVEYLLDIDNAILGEQRRAYLQYEERLRQEYSWVEDEQYNRKRAKVIKALLDRKTIFHTKYFRRRRERKAKKNLKAQLAKIMKNIDRVQ